MRALLAEYTIFNDPALASEGAAMLSVLSQSFECCGYEVVTPDGRDFGEEIAGLAPECDVGLVIAPDALMPPFISRIERLTHNIGCDSMAAAVCANKLLTAEILAANGISVPQRADSGRRVMKPVSGCGSQGVRLSEGPAGEGEFGQEYIRGEHLSVSLVGSRMIGNACTYYTGKPPLVLAINRQQMEVGQDGEFHYLGGETPVTHPMQEEISAAAVKAMTVLGCQGCVGVDMVVADRAYVVDVNPRPTTSIVGIAACMEEEIADILVQASKGGGPDEVHLRGRVRFDKDGNVTRI